MQYLKDGKRDTYKFIVAILLFGIPHVHSYYSDAIVKLHWSIGR
jgi:hypothetical protein